jgi:hypothetical protein
MQIIDRASASGDYESITFHQRAPMSQPIPDPTLGYQNALYVDRDQEHLRILSIFWYVWAGLATLMGCVPIFHLTFGLVMIFSPRSFAGGGGGPPPPFIGWFFVILAGAFMCVAWSQAVLGFLAARALSQRRRLLLCQIAAGIACVNIPLGTVLGVFTFVVLSRPQVRNSFT